MNSLKCGDMMFWNYTQTISPYKLDSIKYVNQIVSNINWTVLVYQQDSLICVCKFKLYMYEFV